MTDYETACYPRWRYHRTLPARIVATVEDDRALGEDWANTPAAFYERVEAEAPRPKRGRPRKSEAA